MSKLNDIYTVIVPADASDLNKHLYTQIYGGSTGCSIIVNGVTVSIGKESKIDLRVNTVSGGNGCYLLGFNKDVVNGSPNLGSISV